jgi:hypothetical protein
MHGVIVPEFPCWDLLRVEMTHGQNFTVRGYRLGKISHIHLQR